MKKIILLILCLIIILTLAGCKNYEISNETLNDPALDGAEDPENALEDIIIDLETLNIKTAYANYSNDAQIYRVCLNGDKMLESAVQHMPIYKFDVKEELERFKNDFSGILTMDLGYDETPSFNDAVSGYDDDFFAEHTLLLAYIQANSGSFRYGIKDIVCDDSSFCMYIHKTVDPEVYTCDMSGWFVMAEFEDRNIQNCESFDAQLINETT